MISSTIYSLDGILPKDIFLPFHIDFCSNIDGGGVLRPDEADRNTVREGTARGRGHRIYSHCCGPFFLQIPENHPVLLLHFPGFPVSQFPVETEILFIPVPGEQFIPVNIGKPLLDGVHEICSYSPVLVIGMDEEANDKAGGFPAAGTDAADDPSSFHRFKKDAVAELFLHLGQCLEKRLYAIIVVAESVFPVAELLQFKDGGEIACGGIKDAGHWSVLIDLRWGFLNIIWRVGGVQWWKPANYLRVGY
jgi:hypothetical protein